MSGHHSLDLTAMEEVSDYQFAYFNNIIYNEQDLDGPVSDFRRFSGSGKLESGLAAITCIRADQVCHKQIRIYNDTRLNPLPSFLQVYCPARVVHMSELPKD